MEAGSKSNEQKRRQSEHPRGQGLWFRSKTLDRERGRAAFDRKCRCAPFYRQCWGWRWRPTLHRKCWRFPTFGWPAAICGSSTFDDPLEVAIYNQFIWQPILFRLQRLQQE